MMPYRSSDVRSDVPAPARRIFGQSGTRTPDLMGSGCEPVKICMTPRRPVMQPSQMDVFVASRTHELRVFTGSADDAREFAASLVEQLRDQGPASRNPYIPPPALWTPENWRDAKNDSASRFRQGITSCAWFGPAGLEVRIEGALEAPGGES